MTYQIQSLEPPLEYRDFFYNALIPIKGQKQPKMLKVAIFLLFWLFLTPCRSLGITKTYLCYRGGSKFQFGDLFVKIS